MMMAFCLGVMRSQVQGPGRVWYIGHTQGEGFCLFLDMDLKIGVCRGAGSHLVQGFSKHGTQGACWLFVDEHAWFSFHAYILMSL